LGLHVILSDKHTQRTRKRALLVGGGGNTSTIPSICIQVLLKLM
jgi:hypothetical protein